MRLWALRKAMNSKTQKFVELVANKHHLPVAHPRTSLVLKDIVLKDIVFKEAITLLSHPYASPSFKEGILACLRDILDTSSTLPHKEASSTKALSHREFLLDNSDKVDGKVLTHIQGYPDLCREDISNNLGIRLSTVTGSVNRLMNLGYIVVSGQGKSESSGRQVELLRCNHE